MRLQSTIAAIPSSLQTSPWGQGWRVVYLRTLCPQPDIVCPHPLDPALPNWPHNRRWTLMRQIHLISPRATDIILRLPLFMAFRLFINKNSRPNLSLSQQCPNHLSIPLARNPHSCITYPLLDKGSCQPLRVGRVLLVDHINRPSIRFTGQHDPRCLCTTILSNAALHCINLYALITLV